MNFEQLGLNSSLLKSIQDLGHSIPTQIQSEAIPLLLQSDMDFIGQAQTGTGKTAAFVLPLLHNIDPNVNDVQALILTPTRELADQVQGEIVKLGKYLPIKSVAIYGGSSYTQQKRALKHDKPQIVVATPGRCLDLIKQKILNFGQAKYFILDEADEMLKMGLLEDVQEILSQFTQRKNLWLFSATLPKPVHQLINKLFNNPQIVKVSPKAMSAENIEQKYYLVKRKHHLEALKRVMEVVPDFYGIVFCQTKIQTQQVHDHLMSYGFKSEALHGDMKQNHRNEAMKRFKSRKINLLVCTDVAARGIDVTGLTHVINMGLPRDIESYVHRIGRTGRAGQSGIALSFVDPEETRQLYRIEQHIHHKIELHILPKVSELKEMTVDRELLRISSTVTAVVNKGQHYELDQTFDRFQEHLAQLDKEQLLKLFFTWKFNKEFRRFEEQGDLDCRPGRPSSDRSRSRRSPRSSASSSSNGSRSDSGNGRSSRGRRSSGYSSNSSRSKGRRSSR